MPNDALLVLIVGVAMLAMTTLTWRLRHLSLSAPIVFVAAGAALAALPVGLVDLDPLDDAGQTRAVEVFTELMLVVAVAGAGLRIDRKFGWRSWQHAWRLLGPTTVITMVGVTAAASVLLDVGAGAAILVAAILVPTDPVLARAVQVGAPATSRGEGDDVRFALTAEAGMNDGATFPLVHLGLAMLAAGHLSGALWHWAWRDLAVGVAVAVAVGGALAWLIGVYWRRSGESGRDVSNAGPFSLGGILVAYGLAEVSGGYGLIAVFVAFLLGRQHNEPTHAHHNAYHDFLEQLELILLSVLLLGIGAVFVDRVAALVTPPVVAVAVLLVFVIRPAAGWLSFVGASVPRRERFAIAFFGLRGVGSIYYLSHVTLRLGDDTTVTTLWAVTITTVTLSILVHGVAQTGLFDRLVGRHEDLVTPPDADPG